MNLIDILNNILSTNTKKDVAKYCNISLSTLNRWIELNNIPEQYKFELMKLNNQNINYNEFDYKQKDQFFTPHNTVKECFVKFKEILQNYNDNINDYIFIEPSAGNGSFLSILPYNTIALDIEPKHNKIIQKDFLSWKPIDITKKYIIFGNPPFGLRGHLALKFINHSYEFADYVCFILPQLFESDGKGVPRTRIKKYNLLYSGKVNDKFYSPDNKEIKVNCIFQIWSKYHINKNYKLEKIENNDIKIYSLSNGNSSSQKRNISKLYICDAYIPSTCFTKDEMKYYDNFNNLPNQRGYGLIFTNDTNKIEYKIKCQSINWSNVAFLSTNGSYNLRSSQIIKKIIE